MDVPAVVSSVSSLSLKIARSLWLLVMLFIVGSVGMHAQDVAKPVSEIREILPSEWGVPHPVGLTFSDDFYQMYLVDSSGEFSLSGKTTVTTISPYEDPVGATDLDFVLTNPINIAYDDVGERLFMLDVTRSELAQAQVGEQGIADPATLKRIDISRLGLVDVQGISVDSARERLFILDSAAARIVNMAIDVTLDLNEAPVTIIDLAHLDETALRGIAIHPASHNLFIFSPIEEVLLELTPTGQFVSRYDLAELHLTDVRGMAFGLSADLTDRPETMHLFIADSGLFTDQLRRSSIPNIEETTELYIPLRQPTNGHVAASGSIHNIQQTTTIPVYGKIVELALNPLQCNCTPSLTALIPPPIATSIPITPSTPAESAYTLSIRIVNSEDDAEENYNGNRSIDLHSSDLELVRQGNAEQLVGIRFASVPIPTTATIFNAYLEFVVDEAESEPTTLAFRGEAADNSARFTAVDGNISDRLLTHRSVTLAGVAPWVQIHGKHRSPNLASIVHEIMARDGWHSGSALTFVISGSGKRTVESYDGNPDLAPRLYIEYGLPDPG